VNHCMLPLPENIPIPGKTFNGWLNKILEQRQVALRSFPPSVTMTTIVVTKEPTMTALSTDN